HTLNDVCDWLGGNIHRPTSWEKDKIFAEHPWYAKYDMLAGKSRSAVQDKFSLSIEVLFTQESPERTP
ncbi:MAG: hypothetical protein P8N61_07545, partial [Porticoccaceae bacterium]|nr:hypothetical protein [Porticoccaceae bacterium]